MAEQAGIFIAIEGTDGSGKTTHYELLADKLRTAGYEVATFDFPQYDEPSTYFVKRYLSGAYGTADQVGPYTASLFYSLDRYEAAPLIRQALAEGKIVISNRFTGSNMAHQGTKFLHAEERRGFFIWADNLEYQMLNIPRPDINIVLRVPADIASGLAAQRQPEYLRNKPDIHESDMSHLERSVEVYDDLCNLFPKDFSRIDCVRGGELLPIEAVHKLVWEKLSPLLPRPPRRRGSKQAAVAAKPSVQSDYVQQLPSGTIITNTGHQALSRANLNEDAAVSVLSDELPQAVWAAVLAALPESEQDIGVSLLQSLDLYETRPFPATNAGRYLTSRIVLNEASQLALMQLQSLGRGLNISEQLLSATDYARRDKHGRFRYFVPPELNGSLKNQYCDSMDKIFESYANILQALTHEPSLDAAEVLYASRRLASVVLPLATTTTAGCMASGAALENSIVRLETHPTQELRTIGNSVLEQASASWPNLKSELGQPPSMPLDLQDAADQLRQVTSQLVPDDYDSGNGESVTITDVWPRNELDIVPQMVYRMAGKSLTDIRKQSEDWTYDQKYEAFEAYFAGMTRRINGDVVLDAVTYSWDIVTAVYGYRELQRILPAGTTAWQSLTPRYGYDVSSVIDEAGLSDELEKCFDESLKLHSNLQQAGHDEQAQYAVLLGHRVRGTVTLNASQAMAIFSNNYSNKLIRELFAKLAEKHPLLAEIISARN